jgi:hypothetical protein
MPGSITSISGVQDRGIAGRSVASSAALQRIGKGGTLASGGGNVAVFSSAAGIGNGADVTEDILFTASLPANTLDIVGRQILLEAWGALSATNAVKTIRMYFGALVYIAAQVTPAAVTAGDWSAQLLVTKTADRARHFGLLGRRRGAQRATVHKR